jgi:hypothetical protein
MSEPACAASPQDASPQGDRRAPEGFHLNVKCRTCAAGVRRTALSIASKSVQHPLMDDEKIEYRGFFILWRDPLDGDAWTAIITAACPSLFPAIAPNETIDGRDRGDMLGNAKAYVDRLLDHALAA